MFIFSRSSRNGGVVQNQFIFHDEDAHVKSRAAYILLREKLWVQDEDYLNKTDGLFTWLDAREAYLERRQAENGGNLKCDYCGREHLDIGGKRPEDLAANNRNKNLATVDHIVALVNEGDKFNEDNMCVACKKCNGKKGEKTLEDFLSTFTDEDLRKVTPFLIERAANRKILEEAFNNEEFEGKIIAGKPEPEVEFSLADIKLPELPLHIKKLNTKRLLAYYKAARKRYHRLVSSFTCECCGEPVWHLYNDESSKAAQEQEGDAWKYLRAIKKELDQREYVK